MGGGPGGFTAFFAQFAANMNAAWKALPQVELDDALQKLIIEQADATFGKTPLEQLERERDDKQIALLRALASVRSQDQGSP